MLLNKAFKRDPTPLTARTGDDTINRIRKSSTHIMISNKVTLWTCRRKDGAILY